MTQLPVKTNETIPVNIISLTESYLKHFLLQICQGKESPGEIGFLESWKIFFCHHPRNADSTPTSSLLRKNKEKCFEIENKILTEFQTEKEILLSLESC